MNADPELRERFTRAATEVRVDTEGRLGGVRHIARRRRTMHQASIVAVIVALSLIVVGTVWQLRSPNDEFLSPGEVQPLGRIAFSRPIDPARPDNGADLFVVDAASRSVAPLDEGAGNTFVAQWSPDGSSVAFIREAEGGTSYAIVVARADGTNPVAILELPKAEGTAGPDLISLSWSPDGSRIAYSGRTRGRGRTVAVIQADGMGGEPVLPGHWESVSWSPDGERLLVLGWPEGTPADRFDLYTLRPDGTDLQRLTDDEAVEHQASWSPDGTKIVFSKGAVVELDQDVYVMDADGSNLERLTSWSGPDLCPVWSPDANWIAFGSDRSAAGAIRHANLGGEETFAGVSIYAMRPDGSDTRLLRDAGDLAECPLSWAP